MDTRIVAREKQYETWAEIINECRNSGMLTKDWLAQNNISRDQYYYWFKLLRERACENEVALVQPKPKNQVVKIECNEAFSNAQNKPKSIVITYGDMRLDIPSTTNICVINGIMEAILNAE